MPCINAAKTRNPLKLAGVPQTNERISADREPKFTILQGHVEEVLLLNKKCEPMPNVVAALPNIGVALCSTPQSLADAHY